MRRALLTAAAFLAACGATAAEEGFTLDLEKTPLERRDPRTEARLAGWNSPTGRVRYHLQQEQGMIGFGGLVGGGSSGVAFRLRLQEGLSPHLVVASIDRGIELYERTVTVVRFPWQEDPEEGVLPMERQLGLLLGRRLEAR